MNVLLVEDNQTVRDSLAEFLCDAGHTILECSQGEEALDRLKNHAVDLVLSDIQMPVMDGHKLLSRIKSSESWKGIEVVLFTGYGHVKDAVEAMRKGAYDYLVKPVNVNELDLILKRISEYLALKQKNRELTDRFDDAVHKATEFLEVELTAVRRAFAKEIGAGEAIVLSDSMRRVFDTADKLHARPDVPVLIEGETGTGKELVARRIHFGLGDILTPFVGLNCATITAALFESELFGYEAGSFTGGHPKGRAGKLELAGDGTLFLDEITELSAEHQAKWLRVIQEREYFKVGGIRKIRARARFICTTNQDIARMVREGRFRQDLYFRLNVGAVRIPPLRERREEIVPLAQFFLDQLRQQKTIRFRTIHQDACRILENHSWPGNVRELKNTIERIALYWDDDTIRPEHLESCLQYTIVSSDKPSALVPVYPAAATPLEGGVDLKTWTLDIVRLTFDKHQGNQTQTARALGLSVRELHTYLKKLKIKPRPRIG